MRYSHLHDWLRPAVDRWIQVVDALETGMRMDYAVFGQRQIAHPAAGIVRRYAGQQGAGRHDVGKIFGVDLRSSVIAMAIEGDALPRAARDMDAAKASKAIVGADQH